MILRYKANKKRFKKPIDLTIKETLSTDARIFLNNLPTISNKNLKAKRKNYIKIKINEKEVKILLCEEFKKKLNELSTNPIDENLKCDLEEFKKILGDMDYEV